MIVTRGYARGCTIATRGFGYGLDIPAGEPLYVFVRTRIVKTFERIITKVFNRKSLS